MLLTGGLASHSGASGGAGPLWALPEATWNDQSIVFFFLLFLIAKIKQLNSVEKNKHRIKASWWKMLIFPHFSVPKDTPGH